MTRTATDQTVYRQPDDFRPTPQEVPAASGADERPARWLARVAGALPTLLVTLLLAGLGVYGHHSQWKLPKFSALAGGGSIEREDWCEEHGVPESQCVECDADLLPPGKDFGWCKEHGVANCPLCHPEVAQLKQTPEASPADRQRAARALASAPRLENNPACKTYRRRIQFASLDAMKKVGVDVAVVDRQPIEESISANGQITYDQTRFASLSSRLPGTVWRVEKNVGDSVRAGEVLVLIDAADVGRAKAELIQAMAHEQLQRNILARVKSVKDLVSGGKAQEAQAELVQAQARLLTAQQALVNLGLPVDIEQLRALPEEQLMRRLRWLGLPESVVQQLDPAGSTSNLLPITAPLDGIVVNRQVVAGEVVDASRVLFQLADTRRMWLILSVSEQDAERLSLGQPVRFGREGRGDDAGGTIDWISTAADQQTRMVTVRAALANREGKLRNGTFGAGKIILREEPEANTVPHSAIHWDGDCHVVFVRDKGFFDAPQSPKVFHVRSVRPGTRGAESTEIVAGVLPGEVVAAKGSDVLRAELLKNRLGEGCCAGK